MIALTRLDGKELVVNADHILTVEATPDTVVLLTTGLHLMVKEPVAEIIDRTAQWRRRIHLGPELKGVVLPFQRATSEE
ncbi:MAG: flagellar FlbD family protein [Deltaproteobacteria bacterium]|jgi:flagellar protein FlbD|nr:flagellar FlbD family protein [Deltaproteobacteria bacterium]